MEKVIRVESGNLGPSLSKSHQRSGPNVFTCKTRTHWQDKWRQKSYKLNSDCLFGFIF